MKHSLSAENSRVAQELPWSVVKCILSRWFLPVWLFEHCHSQYKQQLFGLSSLVHFLLEKAYNQNNWNLVCRSWSSSSPAMTWWELQCFSYDGLTGMCWPWEICAGESSWKAVDISSLLYATTPERATYGNAFKDCAAYSALQPHCTRQVAVCLHIKPAEASYKNFAALQLQYHSIRVAVQCLCLSLLAKLCVNSSSCDSHYTLQDV